MSRPHHDQWGRASHRAMPIQAGEVATYDTRSPRLGFIVTVMSSAVFWIPVTVGALVWVGHR